MKDIPTDRLFRRAHIEAKYDGARTIWFITKAEGTGDEDPFGDSDSFNYTVKCVSRSGKELFNFGNIGSQLGLLTRSRHFPDCGLVVDGEVMSNSFNQLMTQFRRKDLSETTIDAFLMAFDAIRMDEFMSHSTTPKFDDRRSYLELLIEDLHEMLGNVQTPLVLPSIILKNIDPVEQQDTIMDFFEKQVQANFEGIIIKDAEATYEWDRTVNMLKMKPTMTVDLRIVNFTPGRGKFEGTLGALDCEGFDESGRHITVGVSGISDDLRHELWKEGIETVRGRMVEVTADAISKNKDGTYSLRFPRFKQFRNDR
jgi:DNA ligase-1